MTGMRSGGGPIVGVERVVADDGDGRGIASEVNPAPGADHPGIARADEGIVALEMVALDPVAADIYVKTRSVKNDGQ